MKGIIPQVMLAWSIMTNVSLSPRPLGPNLDSKGGCPTQRAEPRKAPL